jgi:dihydropyrimidine dehydrogenase (NAD+) subunit PreT
MFMPQACGLTVHHERNGMPLHRSNLSEDQLLKNFADIAPRYTDDEAIVESSRCLFCFDAPCTRACPTHIDIPKFIRQILNQNVKGSARTILSANLFGGTCARVCPVEALCEGACVVKLDQEKPINIGRLQRYAVDHAMEKDIRYFAVGAKKGRRVAIVGAGPAGVSCAGELIRRGFDATVFEAREYAGGLNTYGIARYKMGSEFAVREVDYIRRMLPFEFRPNTLVGRDVSFGELRKDFDAIFVGVGLGRNASLGIPGDDLDGCWEALEFLEQTRIGALSNCQIGKRVAVIGAGNTAIDCVTAAARLGAQKVMIIYRRSQEEMPAYEYEFELAKSDGVEFLWLTSPVRIHGGPRGQVEGLECIKMELGEPDVTGRRRPRPIVGSEFILPCDHVIYALGQEALTKFLTDAGVKMMHRSVCVDSTTGMTSVAGIFAGGDCISGGKEVVNAVQDGKIAAAGIELYLEEKRHA